MDEDDPEKRVAELEHGLASLKPAARRDRPGRNAEPPPQFSNTQPIAIQGAITDPRARRNARWRAHARAMYPQLRRAQKKRKRLGAIIGMLSAMTALWAAGVSLLAVLPSAALWMSGIVCSSPYHLEYRKTAGGRSSFVTFRCVDGESSYSAGDLVLVIQAIAVALVIAVVTAIAFLIWYLARKRRVSL